MSARRQPTVALVEYSHLLEDYLDNIGVSFEAFRDEMTGGWLFGYIRALQTMGVRSVLFAVSARVAAPWRFTHRQTGAAVCILPAPALYRRVRRRLLNPYAGTVQRAFCDYTLRGLRYLQCATLLDVAPYLMTPLQLLARELRRHHCHVVLCQEYEHPRFDVCVLLGRLLRLPVFATFQGGNFQLSRLERLIRPLTLRACAGLVVATASEAQRLRTRYGVPAEKVARIFNPLDLGSCHPMDRAAARATLGLPMDAEVVAWHGRIQFAIKGLDLLLDAWEQLRRARPGRDLRLLLVGDGADADKLRQRLAGRQTRDILWLDKFIHDRTVLGRYLSAADVYAFPSRHEGFPVAPVEAMACGIPVVAADAEGVPDILEGGEASGGLIVPRDDSKALALALDRMLDDPERRRELGERARRRVAACFSLDAIGAQLGRFLFARSKPSVGQESSESAPGSRAADHNFASDAKLGVMDKLGSILGGRLLN